jgi:HK97 family phage major capsid protein
MDKIKELRDAEAKALDAFEAAASSLDVADDADVEARSVDLDSAEKAYVKAVEARKRAERISEARASMPAVEDNEERSFNIGTGKAKDVYSPQSRNSYFTDIVMRARGDVKAAERLATYGAQRAGEHRDMAWDSDTGGADLLPPVYLAEYAVLPARAGRPFADAIGSLPLPEKGGTLTIPALDTGSSAAAQTAGNQPVSETDPTTSTVTVPLVTVAGQVDMSLQLYERGEAVDQIIFNDLIAAYNTNLDYQLINGSGSNGQHRGIRNVSSVNTVTYTDSGPTAAELTPKVYDAAQKVWTNRFAAPSHLVVHPRRSAFLASNLSSTFPLFQVGSYTQALGGQDKAMVFNFAGLEVVNDANVGATYGASTNEDEMYVVRAADLLLMEGPLRTRVDFSVLSGTLEVRLQVFAYSYFAANRYPKAISIISGTGLATPTF